jgi:hypothetical protein
MLEVFFILIKLLKTHVKQPLNYFKIIKPVDLNIKPEHILLHIVRVKPHIVSTNYKLISQLTSTSTQSKLLSSRFGLQFNSNYKLVTCKKR